MISGDGLYLNYFLRKKCTDICNGLKLGGVMGLQPLLKIDFISNPFVVTVSRAVTDGSLELLQLTRHVLVSIYVLFFRVITLNTYFLYLLLTYIAAGCNGIL